MPLFEVTDFGLDKRSVATFSSLGMYERADIQRLLRDNISALDEDLLVIAEEFGDWEDARRRIDLLAIDKTARLVVIELKRTDDGGHMDLQAIRYAAMVSSMGFDEIERAFSAHLIKHDPTDALEARAELLSFLDASDDEDGPVISSDVRIILVSADFGREITTAVLWLNGFDGMDIRCVRLLPYEIEGRILLDIQQVLPLPEAADYQVRLRRKDVARDRAHTDTRDFTRFHIIVDGVESPDQNKRGAIRLMIEALANKGVPLTEIQKTLPPRAFKVVPGRVSGGESVGAALQQLDPNLNPRRFFRDHPFIDPKGNRTFVLFKMWGRNTEATLARLSEAFPDAKVGFRRADEAE